MDPEKKSRLEAHGWKVGSAEEFLGLTSQEAAYVDLRLSLMARPRAAEGEQTESDVARLIEEERDRGREEP